MRNEKVRKKETKKKEERKKEGREKNKMKTLNSYDKVDKIVSLRNKFDLHPLENI